ncbi:hypothetical protein AGMMS49992_16790 [Clostridia bacterium]|nr:hypothetical protein AGMMS49992_16790 [Clostridia bacterium]
MLNENKLISDCLAVVGWPYVSPGTNDERGIDCSGMLCRAYKLQGSAIYHGSNRIARVHCRDVMPINGVSSLQPGMVVFKWRDDGQEGNEYKPGGLYYNYQLNGNFYHIGLVAQVEPLKIVHATDPKAKVDTALGNWTWRGYLKEVEYNTQGGAERVGFSGVYRVHAATGQTVNMRSKPTISTDNRVALVPVGDYVEVAEVTGSWAYTKWHDKRGYIQMQYLIPDGQEADAEPVKPDTDEGTVTIQLNNVTAQLLYYALEKALY